MMQLQVRKDTFSLADVFTISRGSRTMAQVVTVELSDGTYSGRGEAVPKARYRETVDGVINTIQAFSNDIAAGLDRHGLQQRLKPGAARNALDCAFWDLEAKRQQTPVWQLAGLSEPKPVLSAYTLSLAEPEQMHAKAVANAHRPLLKVKLGSSGDLARLQAVREGAPDSTIIVDANEGWDIDSFAAIGPELVRLGVSMVEQPLPSRQDQALADLDFPIPLCADESCHDRRSLAALQDRYQMINIKLDKTGGLSEALALKQAAIDAGFQIMVGCMVGSSLAMAPAVLVAQDVQIVDLDGPLLLAEDRAPSLQYDNTIVYPAQTALWG